MNNDIWILNLSNIQNLASKNVPGSIVYYLTKFEDMKSTEIHFEKKPPLALNAVLD